MNDLPFGKARALRQHLASLSSTTPPQNRGGASNSPRGTLLGELAGPEGRGRGRGGGFSVGRTG